MKKNVWQTLDSYLCMVDALENRRNHKTRKRARDCLDSAQQHTCGTIVGRYLEDEPYHMRMHEQGHAQSDMEELVRIANETNIYGRTAQSRRRQQDRKDQGTQRIPTNCTVEKGDLDQSMPRSRCGTMVIAVIRDTVTFDKGFMVGFFFATVTLT